MIKEAWIRKEEAEVEWGGSGKRFMKWRERGKKREEEERSKQQVLLELERIGAVELLKVEAEKMSGKTGGKSRERGRLEKVGKRRTGVLAGIWGDESVYRFVVRTVTQLDPVVMLRVGPLEHVKVNSRDRNNGGSCPEEDGNGRPGVELCFNPRNNPLSPSGTGYSAVRVYFIGRKVMVNGAEVNGCGLETAVAQAIENPLMVTY